ERRAAAFPAGDEPDMRAAVRKPPGHDVARLIIVLFLGNRQRLSVAAEKHREIRNAPLIGIRIAVRYPPKLTISAKGLAHSPVDKDLEVHAYGAIGTDNDVGTNAALDRNVTAGEGNSLVTGIVSDGLPDLRQRAVQQAPGGDRGLLRKRGG